MAVEIICSVVRICSPDKRVNGNIVSVVRSETIGESRILSLEQSM